MTFHFKVEKVLQQGDLSDCAEPYVKQDLKVNKWVLCIIRKRRLTTHCY